MNTMLLPSALQCEPPRPTTRLQASLMASPPASPPSLSTQSAFGNILSTCRSLQSLMAPPDEPLMPLESTATALPTPPMSHAEPPPLKLRLRPRSRDEGERAPRVRVAKRGARGNKRRRVEEDGRETEESEVDDDVEGMEAPQTPKRGRIAPEVMPLGLARGDYHDLHLQDRESAQGLGISAHDESDDEWTAEDDRVLVELVLEKMRLSRSDWQDCARSLGRDKHGVGRRWKSLMASGEVGLKSSRGGRRARLHSTWR